jgi:hypothetical protein
MTQDEIIAMLRAACDKDKVDPEQNGFWVIHTPELEAFANLVAEHERKACLPPTPISENALYTAPPQRTWVGLTDEELYEIRFSQEINDTRIIHLFRKLEAKLKEKNETY